MSDAIHFAVVMPLFNKAPYVREALLSILSQRIAAAEIVVVDDGSTDGGADLARQIADPRIRVITQANAGVSAARNAGIHAATTPFVAFLDADDRFGSAHLSTLARLIDRFPQASMFATAARKIDAQGHAEEVLHPWLSPGAEAIVDDFHGAWARRSFTNTNGVAVRREVLLKEWPAFPLGERLGEDQDLWFRLTESYILAFANVATVDYRIAIPGSATRCAAILDPLPCYGRLSQRLLDGRIPLRLRPGARRLLASHLLNIAAARANAGDIAGACQLAADRRAMANPGLWCRTALKLAAASVARKTST